MILQAVCRLLMMEQVFFSLPWSLAAIVLAWSARVPDASIRAVLAILGVILARTLGMSLNRWIDRDIDLVNPRTSSRPLQSGQIKLQQLVILTLANLALLFMIAASLGWFFVALFPFVTGLLVLYSFCKRFTWLCHIVLGFIYALGPILSYLVICDRIDMPVLFLGASAGFSIIAGDLIYSMQDMEHDRQFGLHSIPARFGFDGARYVSFFFYLASILSLALCGYNLWGFNLFFWFPWLGFSILPIWVHSNLKKKDRLYEFFFRCSSLMPLMAFLAVVLPGGFSK